MGHPFSAARVRRSPSFPRLTGVSLAVFDDMLGQLAGPWAAAQKSKRKSGRPLDIGGLEDHLLVTLIYYRCYITQEFLGFFYNVDRSAICRAIQRTEALAQPLFGVKHAPKINRKEAEAMIVDCTEQPIERPCNNAVQREHYSGKKKRHTLKTEYLITKAGRIASVSPSHPGSHHDLAIRRAGRRLPKRVHLYADSGYQGYDKDHRNFDFPYKKPRGGELNEEEREYNRGLSRFRVGIEHRIGGTKRFKILAERHRNPRPKHCTKTSIVAGIVNMNAGFPAC